MNEVKIISKMRSGMSIIKPIHHTIQQMIYNEEFIKELYKKKGM